MKGLGRIFRGDDTVNRLHRGEVSLPVAHIEKRPDRRKPWRVRYRDPTGRERSRSCARKADADRFMATVQADLIRGEQVRRLESELQGLEAEAPSDEGLLPLKGLTFGLSLGPRGLLGGASQEAVKFVLAEAGF